MATPPTQQEIKNFSMKHPYIGYAEARKRLLREYFFTELKEIEDDKACDDTSLDIKITRLAKVVGEILVQL